MNLKALAWTLLVVANVLVISVLSLHRSTDAAPPTVRQPFNNSIEQRNNMIEELREIKALLKEQNTILRGIAAQEKPDDQNQRK